MLEVIAIILVLYITIQYYRRTLMLDNHEGCCVFITGCDTGFGNMLAKRLDSMGCTVFAGCLTETGGNELKRQTSDRLSVVPLDVTNTDSIEKACQIVKFALPPNKGLWGLVNNAGVGKGALDVEWLTLDDYKYVIDVNFYGIVETTRQFLPLIRKERGRIVCITSMAGRVGCVSPSYSASKYAAEGYCDCLRRSVKKQGITVHILEPGLFATNLTDSRPSVEEIKKNWEKLDMEVKEFYGQEYKERTIQAVQRMLSETRSPDTYKVVDAYVHALFAKYPKYRYVVGKDANTIFRFLLSVPEWVSDLILTKDFPVPVGMKNE